MTVQPLPWILDGQTHSAEVVRNHTSALLGAPDAAFMNSVAATTAGGSHGVIGTGGADLAVTQNGTPNMSVNVGAGRAFVRSGNASSIAAGTYAVMNDATVNVSISASDPTNPRIDLVVIQVRDNFYGEAADDVRITVVTGTPAASPAVPALTLFPNALVLAQVAVAAATTTITNANITDKRTFAAATGAVRPCTSTTRPSTTIPFGQRIFEIDTGRELMWDQTGWVIMFEPIQAYTPTTTNLTLGNGTLTGWYKRSDGFCDFGLNFALGSTSAVGAGPTFTLPVAASAVNFVVVSDVTFFHSGLAKGVGVYNSGSPTIITPAYISSLTATATLLGAAAPFAWVTGDAISITGRFRMGTRYL